MKNYFIYIFIIMFICSINSLFSQIIIHDPTFESWIKQYISKANDNYFVLLNPNELCLPCHEGTVKILCKMKGKKIILISYDDLIGKFRACLQENGIIILEKDPLYFRQLGYLRYRNALIKSKGSQIQLLLKLHAENLDSL